MWQREAKGVVRLRDGPREGRWGSDGGRKERDDGVIEVVMFGYRKKK